MERNIGGVMGVLESKLKARNMRVIDLFRMMDNDGSGQITLGELRAGLHEFTKPRQTDKQRLVSHPYVPGRGGSEYDTTLEL